MALINYTLPFGNIGPAGMNWGTIATGLQTPRAAAVNGLLYDPADHQPEQGRQYNGNGYNYQRNDPYSPPYQRSQYNGQSNHYLPPTTRSPFNRAGTSQQVPPTRSYSENSYSRPVQESDGRGAAFFEQVNYRTDSAPTGFSQSRTTPQNKPTPSRTATTNRGRGSTTSQSASDKIPGRPGGYVQVQSGQGKKTQTVAVVDYDDEDESDNEEYFDAEDGSQILGPDGDSRLPGVTPIQGPIFLGRNGTVPVVPLVQNPTNSSYVQIPIWWTALSVALGLNVRGDVIQGKPCIKRNHQLFCPQAGSTYPKDKIEMFIDENKALMKRMYGSFEMTDDYEQSLISSKRRRRRDKSTEDEFEPDWAAEMFGPPGSGPDPIREAGPTGDSYFAKLRNKRQAQGRGQNRNRGGRINSTGRVDACESKVEIITPYWASNSAGKIRAIVNTQHFEQAIHQEVCMNVQTSRCAGDCGCEQKYKWHRLLAYDPDNDCKGIFMDWFLFPSCCVCRCNPLRTS